jgi:hypothetical protein
MNTPDPLSVARRVQEACAKACDAVRVSVLGHGHEVAVAACRDAIRALSLALPPTTGDAETEPAAGTRWPSVERRLKHERQFPVTPPPSKGGDHDDAFLTTPVPTREEGGERCADCDGSLVVDDSGAPCVFCDPVRAASIHLERRADEIQKAQVSVSAVNELRDAARLIETWSPRFDENVAAGRLLRTTPPEPADAAGELPECVTTAMLAYGGACAESKWGAGDDGLRMLAEWGALKAAIRRYANERTPVRADQAGVVELLREIRESDTFWRGRIDAALLAASPRHDEEAKT